MSSVCFTSGLQLTYVQRMSKWRVEQKHQLFAFLVVKQVAGLQPGARHGLLTASKTEINPVTAFDYKQQLRYQTISFVGQKKHQKPSNMRWEKHP